MEDSTNTQQLPAASRSQSAKGNGWPRITLVTAVRNGAKYLEATIRSVLHQAYPNLEYIVVDGASTDGTQEIIRRYEPFISWWISQRDNGLYDALNTGFARSTGEIMGWLNASDMLHTGGLAVVGSVFNAFPKVHWITGRPTAFAEDGSTTGIAPLPRWARTRYLAGANRYIQQESTYWRRELWERAGGRVDASRRDASDVDLWLRFFRHAQLYSVDSLIGGYRMHSDSIVAQDREGYDRFDGRDCYVGSECLKGKALNTHLPIFDREGPPNSQGPLGLEPDRDSRPVSNALSRLAASGKQSRRRVASVGLIRIIVGRRHSRPKC